MPTVGDLRVPLELPVACTLKVVSANPGKQTFELNNLNWGGDAKLTGDKWALTTNKADRFPVSGRQHGTHRRHLQVRRRDAHRHPHVTHTAVCGAAPGMTRRRSRLRSPLPIPVNRYPLVCEPAGNRLCR